ncbi:hypothetical protein FGIG_08830 [Fasciola gigantica]|uniref:Uncharacterized protein n=1 Tax=Fasciola gigantica TaxID=46835 RepID=A0A504YNG9_FASGI|nr:hypothetical protein FGIG_08830 [Fasciola gigantica]
MQKWILGTCRIDRPDYSFSDQNHNTSMSTPKRNTWNEG